MEYQLSREFRRIHSLRVPRRCAHLEKVDRWSTSSKPDTYATAAGFLREAAWIHACDSNLVTNDKRGEEKKIILKVFFDTLDLSRHYRHWHTWSIENKYLFLKL